MMNPGKNGSVLGLDRNQLLALGLALGMVACFLALFYIPKTRQLSQAQVQLKELRAEIPTKAAESSRLPTLTTEVTERQRRYDRDLARIPNEPRMPEFLHNVADILTREGIGQRELVPQKEKPAKNYTEIPVALSFDAPFTKAYRVIVQLENLNRISRTESLSISMPAAGFGLPGGDSPTGASAQLLDGPKTAAEQLVHVEMKIVIFHSRVNNAKGPGQGDKSRQPGQVARTGAEPAAATSGGAVKL